MINNQQNIIQEKYELVIREIKSAQKIKHFSWVILTLCENQST